MKTAFNQTKCVENISALKIGFAFCQWRLYCSTHTVVKPSDAVQDV